MADGWDIAIDSHCVSRNVNIYSNIIYTPGTHGSPFNAYMIANYRPRISNPTLHEWWGARVIEVTPGSPRLSLDLVYFDGGVLYTLLPGGVVDLTTFATPTKFHLLLGTVTTTYGGGPGSSYRTMLNGSVGDSAGHGLIVSGLEVRQRTDSGSPSGLTDDWLPGTGAPGFGANNSAVDFDSFTIGPWHPPVFP